MKGKDVKKIIMLAVGSALGVLTVICGALIIWQVVSIYGGASGGSIFTRANVGAALKRIAPALWLWLALAVVAFGVGIYCNITEKIGKLDIRTNLYRLRRRVPKCAANAASGNGEYAEAAKTVHRENVIKIILWCVCGAIALSGVIYALVYLCNPANFPTRATKSNVLAEIVRLIKHFIPFVTWTFLFACGIGVYEKFSAQKQIPHLKKLADYPASEYGSCDSGCPHNKICAISAKARGNRFLALLNKHKVNIVRIAVGCVAVAFIVAGVFNRGASDVLQKAINICTECIGLG